jgi:hypothetical protein
MHTLSPLVTVLASGRNFGRKHTKVAAYKSQRPEKFAAEFSADFSKNGRELAELLSKWVLHMKALIVCKITLINPLNFSTFC